MNNLQSGSVVVPVLYCDDDVIAVNKPAGVTVFSAPGYLPGTLSQIVLDAGISLFDGPELELPGVVHRLDKDTSGTMVLARSEAGWLCIKKQVQAHEMQKTYIALVQGGFLEQHGRISVPIGAVRSHGLLLRQADSAGRPSMTEFDVIRCFRQIASLLRLRIETGRTHQIRVHCSYIGHPVLGDYTYGYRAQRNIVVKRQMLHACSLSFVVPGTGARIRVNAPLPNDMVSVLGVLAQQNDPEINRPCRQ